MIFVIIEASTVPRRLLGFTNNVNLVCLAFVKDLYESSKMLVFRAVMLLPRLGSGGGMGTVFEAVLLPNRKKDFM